MAALRVLVVEDSGVMRRLIVDAINGDAGMGVIGIAKDGIAAIEQARTLRPDAITLDIQMPLMDGLGALKAIRSFLPHTPIIMFSMLTTEGGWATLEALSLGASDFVAKPTGMASVGDTVEAIRHELVPKLRALTKSHREYHEIIRTGATTLTPKQPRASLAATAPATSSNPVASVTPLAPASTPARRSGRNARVDCIVIGVSTGGPRALEDIVPAIPANIGVPLLMVQHMPAAFTGLLAERLDRRSAITVVEAAEGMSVLAGRLYIAPGDRHLTVVRKGATVSVKLTNDPPEHSCRPSVDVLFRSAVNVYGANLLGVVLTGMGDDGSGGAKAIAEAGGRVIVQDQTSSIVWGMPGAVVNAGLADAVLPLHQIATEMAVRARAAAA